MNYKQWIEYNKNLVRDDYGKGIYFNHDQAEFLLAGLKTIDGLIMCMYDNRSYNDADKFIKAFRLLIEVMDEIIHVFAIRIDNRINR